MRAHVCSTCVQHMCAAHVCIIPQTYHRHLCLCHITHIVSQTRCITDYVCDVTVMLFPSRDVCDTAREGKSITSHTFLMHRHLCITSHTFCTHVHDMCASYESLCYDMCYDATHATPTATHATPTATHTSLCYDATHATPTATHATPTATHTSLCYDATHVTPTATHATPTAPHTSLYYDVCYDMCYDATQLMMQHKSTS